MGSSNDAYAPPVPATTAAIRDPQEPLTVYPDGTIVLPRQLTHDNTAREVKLANLANELKVDFDGVETEHNWGRRETNIIILRKLTNSSTPEERTNLYISTFRSLIDGIIKSATSLRTSLSLHGTNLIQEAAKAVGHGLDSSFDILYRALEKQALTKPAQAQAANTAMIALITHTTFHSRIMEQFIVAMESKNKALRGYAIGWMDAVLQYVAKNSLEHYIDSIEKILRKGLSDADGTVRERSRAVFWSYSGKFKTKADILYESLPKQTQKSLDATNGQGVLNSKSYDSSLNRGAPPPRPATSHADRTSLKQFIKDKKKEASKTTETVNRPIAERPKSAAPGHDRSHPEGPHHGVKKPVRVPISRPESAASTASIDRRHVKQQSQDLKKAPRKHAEYAPEDDTTATDTTRSTTMTPHAYKKPVRRPIDRPDSAFDRPKSSSSATTATLVASSRPVRPTTKPAVPSRPKTVASVSSSATGTLSSAPKRPNFNRKVVTSASTPSIKPAINIPADIIADLSHHTVPAHIAHVVTPPRALQEPLPLQVLQNPPQSNGVKKESSAKASTKSANNNQWPIFVNGAPSDLSTISASTLNVMASLVSDPATDLPSNSFEILAAALTNAEVPVRRAGMELGAALWTRVEDPITYWSQLEGLPKGSKDFLMYWINRGKRPV